MTKEHAEKLLKYQDTGHRIDIRTGYVDSDASLCIIEGEICYNSEMFSERPLLGVDIYEVSVSKRVEDWLEKDPEQSKGAS